MLNANRCVSLAPFGKFASQPGGFDKFNIDHSMSATIVVHQSTDVCSNYCTHQTPSEQQ